MNVNTVEMNSGDDYEFRDPMADGMERLNIEKGMFIVLFVICLRSIPIALCSVYSSKLHICS